MKTVTPEKNYKQNKHKKATGADLILARVVKLSKYVIGPQITTLINKTTGHGPDYWNLISILEIESNRFDI